MILSAIGAALMEGSGSCRGIQLCTHSARKAETHTSDLHRAGRQYTLRREEPGGIRCQPGPIPMRPCAQDWTYAQKECVRVVVRVLASAARPLPAPIRFAWRHRPKRLKRLDLQLIAALQQTCSPIHAPCLYGTTSRGNLTRVMSD